MHYITGTYFFSRWPELSIWDIVRYVLKLWRAWAGWRYQIFLNIFGFPTSYGYTWPEKIVANINLPVWTSWDTLMCMFNMVSNFSWYLIGCCSLTIHVYKTLPLFSSCRTFCQNLPEINKNYIHMYMYWLHWYCTRNYTIMNHSLCMSAEISFPRVAC